jgi:hypothetical protein
MTPLFVQFLLASVAIAAGSTQYDFCQWTQVRAAVVRDQVWIDGGELWTNNSAQVGLNEFYYLNFSSPFDATTNLTTLFNSKSKIDEQSTNIAPHYIDGTMFANDYEFYLFG